MSTIDKARQFVKGHRGSDLILCAFLHITLPFEYGELINVLTDVSDEQWERYLATIEKQKINIERVNDIHDNDNVKAGL